MPSNFSFLEREFPLLFNLGKSAEFLYHHDPPSCLTKLRLFGEKLTLKLFEEHALELPRYDDNQNNRLKQLEAEGILPFLMKNLFDLIRKKGNHAAHADTGSTRDAREALQTAFKIAKWFYETYSTENKDIFKLHFQEPENLDARHALHLLEQDFKELESKYQELLAQRQTSGISSEKQQTIQQRSEQALRKIEMSEAETRELIDKQLQAVGWEADTATLNYKKHKTKPQKGRNMAIAEWPAGSLWADYALFIGTQLYGFVEAKRWAHDISTDLQQSKIYAEKVKAVAGTGLIGAWGTYQAPFLFSTNGRPYLDQLKTKSGVWFLDVRNHLNQARPLQGWYSPEGLARLLEKDLPTVNNILANSPLDFLANKSGLNLRDYQIKAIKAVEQKLLQDSGERRALLAMATGTGKTRTIIGLCYHLIKTNRFHRILFLVDRTLLGTQAQDAFKDNKIIDLNTFADIYEMQELKQLAPGVDTRLHFATVQSMVKRLFYQEDDLPAVDQYDCLVIDEAHRGYLLDREMDEDELDFKDQADYVSKYRRVLDYFDAFAVALTATPALHTTQIFGRPVFVYSYREAVIDGFLIDHDPPRIIKTHLNENGIVWNRGEKPKRYDKETNSIIELAELDDDLQFDVSGFNKDVLTEDFNRTVIKVLVQDIDPDGEEKTLIFAATDEHADLIVKILYEEYKAIGIELHHDAIKKITGKAYNPQELVTRYKNEKYPTIAVTVDLLTTGIDVPAICNIVFMRRVRSRILYEQMLGRATRRCDEIHKDVFRIFDAVGLYETLEEFTQMQPVVSNPKSTFQQLVEEIPAIPSPERIEQQINQLIAKIQRKLRRMTSSDEERFSYHTEGQYPQEWINNLRSLPTAEKAQLVQSTRSLWHFLDDLKFSESGPYVSEHADHLIGTEYGYGKGRKPADYLHSFEEFVRSNQNEIAALQVICTRPAELTRQSLKELLIVLEQKGFRTRDLTKAWGEARQAEMGADLISMIRTLAIGAVAEPHESRIHRAVDTVRQLQPWNKTQQKWLDRFEAQLLAESVLQVEDLNEAPFREAGGFSQLNKVFNNRLEEVVRSINQNLYQA